MLKGYREYITGANHSRLVLSLSLDARRNILQQREGHPTKGNYWFPAFNSSAGLKALSFIQDQVNAGLNPQKEHRWGENLSIENLQL